MSDDHKNDKSLYRTVVFSHRESLVVLKVEPRFVPRKIVGQGAYGIVCAAKDLRQGKDVCIKKIEGVWHRRALAKRVLRELIFLRHFHKHENIVNLVRVMRPAGQLRTVHVVSELMDMDLSRVIRSQQKLIDDHIQYFMYQIACGLKYIHSAGVIHRDLNPRNMLVNTNCLLKICDFGLARYEPPDKDVVGMSDYVCTRWYRSPEIMTRDGKYSKAADLWSLGCILGELLTRKPLFPGKSEFDQLRRIHQMLDEKKSSTSGQNNLVKFVLAKNPAANPKAIDLMNKLLLLDADKRLTVEQVLDHPYLMEYHDINEEPSCKILDKKIFHFEREDVTKEELRSLIVKEIEQHNPVEDGIYIIEKRVEFIEEKKRKKRNKGVRRKKDQIKERRKSF